MDVAGATPHQTDLLQLSKGLRELIKCGCIKGALETARVNMPHFPTQNFANAKEAAIGTTAVLDTLHNVVVVTDILESLVVQMLFIY